MSETINEEILQEEVKKEFLKYEDEQVEVVEDGVVYIEDTTYRVFTDGTMEVACSVKYPKPSDEPTPEPEQEPDVWAEMAQAIKEGVDSV